MPADLVRLAAGLAVALVLAYAAGVAGLFVLQRRLVFPGAYGPAPRFGPLPAGVEPTSVAVGDGTLLKALWKPPGPGASVVVSFHGNGSFPEQSAPRFAADPWARDGWGFLVIAYRGYPGSTGAPSEAGLIADGLAAYAEARRRAPAARILLHGHSLGGAVAIAVAARHPDALGLYLEAPFASLEALARARFPVVPMRLLLKDPFRSDERIGAVRAPIVIVHGTADDIVPVGQGRRLAAAATAEVTFEAIPADHVSVLGARDAVYEPRFSARIDPPSTR